MKVYAPFQPPNEHRCGSEEGEVFGIRKVIPEETDYRCYQEGEGNKIQLSNTRQPAWSDSRKSSDGNK